MIFNLSSWNFVNSHTCSQRTYARCIASSAKIFSKAHPNDQLSTFKSNTVTYWTASAWYWAIRCLYQLVRSRPSFNSNKVVSNIKKRSNDDRVLESVAVDSSLSESVNIGSDDFKKILSLLWSSRFDTLLYTLKLDSSSNKMTKRTVISGVAAMFDPLSFLGTRIIKGKIIIQKLWQLEISSEEYIPFGPISE